MNRALLVALAAASALGAGCNAAPKKAAAPRAPAASASAAPAAVAATPSAAPEQEWSYSSVDKRDPFRSFIKELDRSAAKIATRCSTPLGRFELEQFRLVAVVTGLADPVAMVEAPTGVGYTLHRGVCVGKNGGTVAAIRTGEVVVSEWAVKGDGTREKAQTVLRLPKEASINLEE